MSLGQATHGQLICAYYYYYLRRPLRRSLLPDRSGFARSASARREGVAAAAEDVGERIEVERVALDCAPLRG